MELVISRGHRNVTAKHKTTIEVTKDGEIGRRADCIIGVGADKGLSQLSDAFKKAAKDEECIIKVVFKADGREEEVIGRGHPDLSFEDDEEMVIRKSDFTCPRTLMIRANKGSRDLDRKMIDALMSGKELVMEITCGNLKSFI